MKTLLTHENMVSSPIEHGDAGIILKSDGTFRIFTTGDIDEPGLTDAQQSQATKLMALAAALAVPSVMDTLIVLSEDKDVFPKGIDLSGAII